MMRRVSCCFTGHRKLPQENLTEIKEKTETMIREILADGTYIFYVGGAVGYDTLAAKLLFKLKETEFPHIRVILAYPFEGFTDSWSDHEKDMYHQLLPKYDDVICVSEAASRGAYLKRDRYLVDYSSCCICYCTKRIGGTAYTVRYAKKKGLNVQNVVDYDLQCIG